MKLNSKPSSLKAIAILALGMSAGSANALPYIDGSIAASGGLAPSSTTAYIVSGLNVLLGLGTGVTNTSQGTYKDEGVSNGAAGFWMP